MLFEYLNHTVLIVGLVFTAVISVFYFTCTRSRQLLNYIPNVWTSLGILGTFIAIARSLASLADKNVVDIDVSGLIVDIGPAFVTSIIGICGAIVTSVGIKFIYAFEDRREEKNFSNVVGQGVSPEMLLNKINLAIEHLIRVSQNQEQNIAGFLDRFLGNLDDFYARIYDANREQVRVLSQEYVDAVAMMLERTSQQIDARICESLVKHVEVLDQILNAEKQKLDVLSEDMKKFLDGVPQSVEAMKKDLIDSLRNSIMEQSQILIDNTGKLSQEIIVCFRNLEGQFASSVIHPIIVQMEEALDKAKGTLDQVSDSLQTNLPPLAESIKGATASHAAVVTQLQELVPVLGEQAAQTGKSVELMNANSVLLDRIVSLQEELSKKNEQLRYELTQWKRVHKKVKVNDKTGNKECPNCGTENPIEANYCRECCCGFWDCESI